MSNRLCVVCGARTPGENAATCDKVCSAAKKNGRTRQEQMEWELQNPTEEWYMAAHCIMCGIFIPQSRGSSAMCDQCGNLYGDD